MAWKIYSYQKCSTCRSALHWLDERGIKYAVVPIRDTPPSVAELKTMASYYGGEWRRLFNTSGLDYKAMNLKEKLPRLSEAQILDLLSTHGNLVKRPFVLTPRKGIVGFKPVDWENLLVEERQ